MSYTKRTYTLENGYELLEKLIETLHQGGAINFANVECKASGEVCTKKELPTPEGSGLDIHSL
jgi:hypothetical protein